MFLSSDDTIKFADMRYQFKVGAILSVKSRLFSLVPRYLSDLSSDKIISLSHNKTIGRKRSAEKYATGINIEILRYYDLIEFDAELDTSSQNFNFIRPATDLVPLIGERIEVAGQPLSGLIVYCRDRRIHFVSGMNAEAVDIEDLVEIRPLFTSSDNVEKVVSNSLVLSKDGRTIGNAYCRAPGAIYVISIVKVLEALTLKAVTSGSIDKSARTLLSLDAKASQKRTPYILSQQELAKMNSIVNPPPPQALMDAEARALIDAELELEGED